MAGGLIGALRVTLGIDTAAFEAGSARARKTAVSDANAISKAYGGIKTAISGLMAGISVGTLVAVTSKALDYASSLQEVAQQLGVTTKDLQEYRYAATQVGISQEEMDKGLAKLTVTMGKARAGAKEPVAAFKALSDVLGKDILKNAATAGDAIPLIADALRRIEDPAKRAAAEVALFGKTGQKLDTLLAGGSAAVNELRDAAQSLGIVLSDEQIANADKTADKLSELKQVLEANIAGAVANNASAIYDLANSLVQLAAGAAKAFQEYKNFGAMTMLNNGNLRQFAAWGTGNDPDKMRDAYKSSLMGNKDGRQQLFQRNRDQRAALRAGDTASLGADGRGIPNNPQAIAAERKRLMAERKEIVDAQRAARRVGTSPAARPATTGDGAGAGTGGGAKKKTASGPKIDPEKQDKRYNDEMARLEDEQLRLESDLSNSTAERSAYAKKRIANDIAAYATELDSRVKLNDITAEQAKKLLAAKKFNAGYEADLENQRAEDETTRQSLETDNERLSLKADLKRGELSEAKSQADRRKLQMELLDIEYDRQRAALEAVLALNSSTDAEKDIARARLAQLDALKAHDAKGVQRDTAGPMEAFGQELHRTAGQIQEDFEQIQVDGIKSLNDGLVDAIINSKSLGDVFNNVVKQMAADLLRSQLQKGLSSLFGGGIGGLLSGIGRIFGGGKAAGASSGGGIAIASLFQAGGISGMRANGGPVSGGESYIVGEAGPEIFRPSTAGMIIPNFSSGKAARSTTRDGGREVPRFEIIPSPWFDVRAAGAAEPSIQSMGAKAASGGSSMAQQSMARRQRQQLGRR